MGRRDRTLDAIVLVGGQGSRLRPLTETTPKPMLPVAGVPFLTHLLLRAREAGIDHVVLSTSYKAEVFADHFGDGSALGLDLEYVQETHPLGTGGGIRNVVSSLRAGPDEPVVIFNGDVLSGHDVAGQVAAHVASGAAVTLHLTEVADARRFGIVPTDADGRVTAFIEKNDTPVTNQINAGCYVFRRDVIDAIPAGRPVSVERETFPGLLAAGVHVQACVESAYWLDLGTPESFVQGSCDLVRGLVASPAVPQAGEWLALAGSVVAADAALTGGTTVGAGAQIAAGAVLDRCVLFDGVSVGAGARLIDCIVGRGAGIGEGVVLSGVVVGDGATVGVGNELSTPARVWTGAHLPDGAVRATVG